MFAPSTVMHLTEQNICERDVRGGHGFFFLPEQ